MMVLLAAAVVVGLAGAPHLLRLDDQPPMLAAVVWLAALALRAVITVFVIVFLLVVLPTTGVFDAITHWCWHAVIPVLATHLGLNGHAVGDVALILPAVIVAASVASVGFGVWRAARGVQRLVRAAKRGGPGNSLIIGDEAVLVAAAGLRRPQVVVSSGALTIFDDAELFASLDHERGHILRRHRWILVAGEAFRGIGRLVPGAKRAACELAFHLERDADRFALERRHEPVALARAIFKAAQAPVLGPIATALNGGDGVRRVRQLLDGAPCRPASTSVRIVAVALVSLVVGLSALLPAAAIAAVSPGGGSTLRHCPR